MRRPTSSVPSLTKAVKGPSGLASPGTGDTHIASSLGVLLEPPQMGTAMSKSHKLYRCQAGNVAPAEEDSQSLSILSRSRTQHVPVLWSLLRTVRRYPKFPGKEMKAYIG